MQKIRPGKIMTDSWYKNGLKFKCTGCGKCCTGSTGMVWVSEEEIVQMAEACALSVKQFKIRYIRSRANRLALVEKKNPDGDFDCIFLENKKCKVYQARPTQCRTYPWWQENLNTEKSWKIAAQNCEGINDSAPIVAFGDIQKNINNS